MTEAFSKALRKGIQRTVDNDQRATRSLHKQVSANLKKLDTQEQNLLDLPADGLVPRATIQKRISAITKQRAIMAAQLENVERKLADVLDYIDAAVSFLERPGEVYANATDEIRRLMNQGMFRRIYVEVDEVTGAELHAPFDALLAADAAFQQESTPAGSKGASMSDESREILNIALDDISSKRNMVGLVQRYSNNSTGVAKLRQLAELQPGRRASEARRPVPRRARRLTDAEKMAFVEGYERGEPVAVLAQRLGMHRTTLDTLVARLGLSRVDPNEVSDSVRASLVGGYRAGESLAVLGERFGFSANKVQRLLVSMGEPIRPRGPRKAIVTSDQIRQMVLDYERGETITAIADAVGVSYAQARGCLIDTGVQLRSRGGAARS